MDTRTDTPELQPRIPPLSSIEQEEEIARPLSKTLSAQPTKIIADRYEVIERMESDTLGILVKARDQALGNTEIGLKIVHSSLLTPAIVHRLQSLTSVARQISHPNIGRVYDFDYHKGGLAFISQELIEGWKLEDLKNERPNTPFPVQTALRIILFTARALAAGHRAGICHGDLQPKQIVICKNGEIKVLAFGLTQALQDSAGLTRTGEMLGSSIYMAPEQLTKGETGATSDIYSLGQLSWMLLAGKHPNEHKNYLEVVASHLQQQLPPCSSLNSKVPRWIDAWIAKCCHKNAADRFRNGEEAYAALLAQLGENFIEQSDQSIVNFLPKPKASAARRNFLRLLPALVVGSIVLSTLLLTQAPVRSRLLVELMRLEYALNMEFPWIKQEIFSSRLSLLNPQRLFEQLDQEEKDDIFALFEAGLPTTIVDSRGRSIYEKINSEEVALVIHRLFNPRNGVVRHQPVPVNHRFAGGNTPLHILVATGQPRSLDLLNYGANPYARNAQGFTPFHIAVKYHYGATVSEFIKRGFDPNLRIPHGITPIMLAMQEFESQERLALIIDILLRAGADPNARDNSGKTALDYAEEMNLPLIADTLRRSTASLPLPPPSSTRDND